MLHVRLSILAGLLSLAACSSNTQSATPEAAAAPEASVAQPAAAAEAAPTAPAKAPAVNPEAVALTLNGGAFANQRVTIAHPSDGDTRPGAAIGFWSAQQGVGTQLDASHEKPTGLILRIPTAAANKAGTYPIEGGALMGNGEGSLDGVTIKKGTVTITTYGNRLVGTFEGSGEYLDLKNNMKQTPVTITGGTFDLQRASDR
jgi:hypothetical protein